MMNMVTGVRGVRVLVSSNFRSLSQGEMMRTDVMRQSGVIKTYMQRRRARNHKHDAGNENPIGKHFPHEYIISDNH